MSPCIKHSDILKWQKQLDISAPSPPLSEDPLSVPPLSELKWLVTMRSWGERERVSEGGRKDGEKRGVVLNRTTETWRGTLEITLKCTQIKVTSWCIFVTLQQRGFGEAWKACVEKGNALSQCHAYIAFQPAIARESRSALFHHSFESTLQSQCWTRIFSDTAPRGAFPCPGLAPGKVRTSYQWQPQALNLVQRRRRIQQVNTLDSFHLPLVFPFLPASRVVVSGCAELKSCGMWHGGRPASLSHMQRLHLHLRVVPNFKLKVFIVHIVKEFQLSLIIHVFHVTYWGQSWNKILKVTWKQGQAVYNSFFLLTRWLVIVLQVHR